MWYNDTVSCYGLPFTFVKQPQATAENIAYLFVYRSRATALYKNIAHLFVPRSRGALLFLFPIDPSHHVDRYRYTAGDPFYLTASVISAHEEEIIKACQNYLDLYESGCGSTYTPDIDGICRLLQSSL